MVASTSSKPRSEKANKVRAILAGGLVLGVGAAFTLAAWTDNEWVFGQSENGGGPPGTKSYQMQQNTYTGLAGADVWSDQGDAPGGALTFSVNADKLVPGSTVYAPMQLRTVPGSEGLSVLLSDAQRGASGDADLYSALRVEIKKNVVKTSCNNLRFGDNTVDEDLIVGPGGALSDTSSKVIPLSPGADANSAGAPVNICFALSLPSDAPPALQGKSTVPLWKFTSTVGVTP